LRRSSPLALGVRNTRAFQGRPPSPNCFTIEKLGFAAAGEAGTLDPPGNGDGLCSPVYFGTAGMLYGTTSDVV